MKRVYFFLFFVLLFARISHAENIYISQSGTGAGASCSNPRSASWFNTSGNWGSGAGQINGGDTVYLCGTITSDLTMQGSGSSGNVITIDGTSATLGTSSNINADGLGYITLKNITAPNSIASPIIHAYGAVDFGGMAHVSITDTQDVRMPVVQMTLPDGRVANTSPKFDIGRNFCNKLWNASRFAMMNLEGLDPRRFDAEKMTIEDKWILSASPGLSLK